MPHDLPHHETDARAFDAQMQAKTPAQSLGDLRAEMRQYETPQAGHDTTFRLSAIEHALGECKATATPIASWCADRPTVALLTQILPRTAAHHAMIRGLELRATSRETSRPLSADEEQLAKEAETVLARLKEQLVERAQISEKVHDKAQNLAKESNMDWTQNAVDNVQDNWEKLPSAAKWGFGGLFLVAGINAVTMLGKNDSSNTLPYGRLGIVGAALAALGAWSTDMQVGEMWDKGLSWITHGLASGGEKMGVYREERNIMYSHPLPELIKKVNLDSPLGEEVAQLSDLPIPTMIELWEKNQANGKIEAKDLGKGNLKFFSPTDTFQLFDTLIKQYPQRMADRGYLSPREKQLATGPCPQDLIREWYQKDAFVREKGGSMKLGHLWKDYVMADPPPGKDVEVLSANEVVQLTSEEMGKMRPALIGAYRELRRGIVNVADSTNAVDIAKTEQLKNALAPLAESLEMDADGNKGSLNRQQLIALKQLLTQVGTIQLSSTTGQKVLARLSLSMLGDFRSDLIDTFRLLHYPDSSISAKV